VRLHHRRPGGSWGSMYHALYAFTGQERLLEEELLSDVNDTRWRLRALELGYIFLPWYARPHGRCEAEIWRELVDKAPDGARAPSLSRLPPASGNPRQEWTAKYCEEVAADASDC
jgi:hypothetical protein